LRREEESMSELLTLDLESPARPSLDDDSTDAIIERADRRARRLRKTVTHQGEVRLVETAIYFDDMSLDEQADFGRMSKYFFRNKNLPRSFMLKLGKLIEKYNGGNHE